MTLIITAISEKIAIQITDRRLTWGDGTVADEMANKSVIGQCQDARFVLSYTGSSRANGRLDGRMTDWWAANCLFDMQLWNKPIAMVGNLFTEQVKRNYSGGAYPTTFVWTGYQYRDLADRQIHRMFLKKTSSHPHPTKTHKVIISKSNFFALADGCITAVSADQIKRIAGVVGQGIFNMKDGKATIEALVPIIGDVSIPNGHGRFIGRNCRGLVLTPCPKDGTETCCYSEKEVSLADTPLIVFPGGVHRMEFRGDEERHGPNPSWSNFCFGGSEEPLNQEPS